MDGSSEMCVINFFFMMPLVYAYLRHEPSGSCLFGSAQSSYSGERGCWNMRYCIGLYGGGYGVHIMMSSALYIAASRFDDNFHI